MFNWRKPLIYTAFSISGYHVYSKFRYLKSIEYQSTEKLLQLQNKKVETLLRHAYQNVPYYKDILADAGVIKESKVFLENFENIPFLTKEIIRREGENLYSRNYKKRHSYPNSSGGSTGEPVELLQNREYQAWGLAHRLLYNEMAGKEVGQRELKLWGSERDVFMGAEKLSTKLRRWGFNVILLNSFRMSDEIMRDYVNLWNSFKPRTVWAYTSSAFEFAKYIKRTNVRIFSPASIICTAETLTNNVRNYIEGIFHCPVLNQYGSREVGVIGCECQKKQGLHVFPLINVLEILDEKHQPVGPGQIGRVYITILNNYSMPLIRYEIGDTARTAKNPRCSCGRIWPLIKEVTGRVSNHFKTRDGKIIHGEFFTHLFYHKKNIKKFRVIQHDYENVEVLMEVTDRIKPETIKEIQDKIKLVLGNNCRVEFKEVDLIPRLASGKYLYTISEIEQADSKG